MASEYFALQPFLYWFLALFAGIVLAILTYLTWGLYRRTRRDETPKPGIEKGEYEVQTFRDLLANPVFPWVVTLFAIVIFSFFAYYVIIGLHGTPVG